MPDAVPSSATAPPATCTYSVELTHAASAEAARVAGNGGCRPAAPSDDRTHRHDWPVVSLIRRRSSGLNPGMSAVHVLRLSNRRGEIVHEEPIVWQVSGSLERAETVGRRDQDSCRGSRRSGRASDVKADPPPDRHGAGAQRNHPSTVETAWARRTRLCSNRCGSIRHSLFSAASSTNRAGCNQRDCRSKLYSPMRRRHHPVLR